MVDDTILTTDGVGMSATMRVEEEPHVGIRRDQVRLGVVQPRARYGEDAPGMLNDAVRYIAEAGRRDIDLLLFPETYPGPTTHRVRYEVVPELARAAAEHGVAVAAGTTEPTEDGGEAYYVSHFVIDERGSVRGAYRRTHPRSEIYAGVFRSEPFWDIDYRAGHELPVFDLGWATIGISICSEVFVPEVARSLALQGAEICLFPTGVLVDDLGFTENWQTLIRARAIENVMFTATTMNLFPAELRETYCGPNLPPVDPETGVNRGHAMIASPERVLAATAAPGILTADLDLARLRVMRESPEFPDGLVVPPPYATLPGVFRLRRPELTGVLSAPGPVPGLVQPSGHGSPARPITTHTA